MPAGKEPERRRGVEGNGRLPATESQSSPSADKTAPPAPDEPRPRRSFFDIDTSGLEWSTLGIAVVGWLVVLGAVLALWLGWHSRWWRGHAWILLLVSLPVPFYFAIAVFPLTAALGKHSRRNTAGLALALAAGAVGWSILLVSRARAPTNHGERDCLVALRRLWFEIEECALESEGRFPPDLRSPSDTRLGRNARVCPGVRHRLLDAGVPVGEFHPAMAYCYVSGLRRDDPTDYVLAFDEEWNHDGRGVNVLYVGRGLKTLIAKRDVEWVTDIEGLQARLGKQAEELRARGREMKIIRPSWSLWPGRPEGYSTLTSTWTRVHATGLGTAVLIAVTVEFVLRRARKRRRQ